MTEVADLYVKLRATATGFSSEMKSAENSTLGFEGRMGKTVAGLTKFGFAAGAIAVGVGAATVKMAGEFQAQMEQLVTGAGETEANLKTVSQGLLTMAGQVGTSAASLASGMYLVESAGFHGAAGLDVMRAAAMGAKVGNADMATVANAVTSALNAYGLSGKDATGVTNALVATVASGKMHMQDLAGALGMVLPSAAALKIPLNQVGGAIATMTAQGTPAADAATYLRFTLMSLANPSKKAADELATLGMSSARVATSLTTSGLPATLAMITDAIGKKFPAGSAGYTAALANIVGGTRGMQAALELTGPHLKTFQDNVAGVATQVKKGGDKVLGWDIINEGFDQRIEKTTAALQSWGIQIGTFLIPYVEKAMDLVAAFVGWLKEHQQVTIALGAAIGTVLVAALVAAAAATVAWTVALLANPVVWIVVGIMALVGALVYAYQHFETFRNIVNAVWSWIKTATASLIGWWKAAWPIIWHTVKAVWDFISAYVKTVIHIVKDIITIGVDLITGKWYHAWQTIKDAVATALKFITDHIGPALAGIGRVIVAGIKAIPGIFLQLGKDMLSGLVRGIKSLGSGAVDAVKTVAGNIVSSVKSFFGINSPSRVFHAIGLGLTQGMINGIGAGHSSAVDAAQRLAASVAGAGSTSLTLAASGGYTGGGSFGSVSGGSATRTIIVQAPVYLDGRLLQRGMIPSVQQYKARNGNTGMS